MNTNDQGNKTQTVSINRNYKDTIFRILFSDKNNLLSLYNAVNETHYEQVEDLEIVTLEDAVYIGMKNDVAFIFNLHLYLYEHQSSYNPNMPLRDLFYIANEYQMLVDNKSLYSSTIQKIPTPRFVVFYNGLKEVKEREELKLSDAYETKDKDLALELKVLMLNINDGHNKELMEQCQQLKEYSQYVATVRRNVIEEESKITEKKVITLEEKDECLRHAVIRAVNECIEKGILRDFLSKHKAEVISVSIFEYDKEKEERLLKEAEFRAGKEEGLEQGIKLTKKIYTLRGQGKTLSEIALECEIPEERIEKILS